jgi:hypothetical protein
MICGRWPVGVPSSAGRATSARVSRFEVGDGWFGATVHGTDAYEVELTEDDESVVPAQPSAAATRAEGLETWLGSLSREELLELVREQLGANRELRRRLELRAATACSDAPVVRERVLALLDPAPFAQYGHVEYTDGHAYGEQAAEAVDALRTLIRQGHAAQAVALAREVVSVGHRQE